MKGSIVAVLFALISLEQMVQGRSGISSEGDLDKAVGTLTKFLDSLEEESPSGFHSSRYRRNAHSGGDDDDDDDDDDRGVTNLDIRDAILQLLNVIRDGTKANEKHDRRVKKDNEEMLTKLVEIDGKALERKIDNISTFLLRINSKLQLLLRSKGKQHGGGADSNELLETLAKESFDILTLIPGYIETNNKAIAKLSDKTDTKFGEVEQFLTIDDNDDNADQAEEDASGRKSISKVVQRTEKNILKASKELKDIVVESGHMAENLFERVNEGYHELNRDIKGFANVEKVLLDTADSVMDTKKKIEFGVQQIIYKIGELVKTSGGTMNSKLQVQFEDITRTILANQNEALGNLTSKVEKEIGQVWRQMGIMYGKVSNSLDMLEKVKAQTETYVNDTGLNLGTMGGQVEGLADRIVDVDENLNYMLGQLSLVVQEFDQVKTGLGEAISGLGSELDEIKEYNLEEGGLKPESSEN